MEIRRPNNKRIIIIALVVGLVGIVGLALVTQRHDGDSATKSQRSAGVEEAFTNSRKLQAKRDYDAAAAASSDQYAKSGGDKDRWILALQTGAVYETKKDYPAALEWYLKAEQTHPNDRGTLSGLARSYEQLGDKQKAISYYRRTIEAIDSKEPGAESYRLHYRQALERVKSQR